MMDRRTLLGAAAAASVTPAIAAADEDRWARIAAQYDVTRKTVQLEHGNWGMMAQPVLAAYRAQVERVNRDTSFYARRELPGEIEAIRARVAATMGVAKDEIAFTRNATEAMRALILGYNKLRPGDAVLHADLDYDTMQACMESLRARRGVEVVKIALPLPATHQAVIDAYARAFTAHPNIRMVLLTQVSHRTGLVLPVAEIAAMATLYGIDAIVDAAHGVGQIDYKLPDLEADFVAINLHKWIGAPLGVGAIVIRGGRLGDVDVDPAEPGANPKDIRSRVHTGTLDYAAQLAVPAALDFQESIGLAAKQARLQALRDRWVRPARELAKLEILTPDEPGSYGAITAFRLKGQSGHDANVALAKHLLDAHGIFTVHRDGLASGSCVRVTPALATTMEEVDRFVDALRKIAR
ncbi:aminotransferase class V-fold PLP-dependent enzyme [Sphingomonas sp. HITSZ_GF]|uniref:aminotransferase class V-fold PLP-dependent enzyme n=1 Tax=Sphingomonas sp. HITSZ_GF TaxID=3037247 RepID=UPI00240E3C62|nr:aminotransferase class V-fold PLP-dependent enzyme [Sphingomonas sp. HITSZ_GF]MDG2535690.1 aminotransferase class V-fold PLP-dependent enzyme [Sphingomonas sp. HITSZ_GF]